MFFESIELIKAPLKSNESKTDFTFPNGISCGGNLPIIANLDGCERDASSSLDRVRVGSPLKQVAACKAGLVNGRRRYRLLQEIANDFFKVFAEDMVDVLFSLWLKWLTSCGKGVEMEG